ncbi:SMP-30/gluconolactonase/LRE family protein, partial [Pseudomonadota bacterium]
TDHKGARLNGPNDIWADARGNIYFTDPLYPREYWDRDPGMLQSGRHVYLLPAGNTRPGAIITNFEQPNGIVGSLDGATLYVSDIDANRTYAYDRKEDGSITNRRLFCDLGSDGMTVDDAGNVYLTGQGVTVFSANGEQIEHIEVPQPWTANVTFGGKQHDMLFITASKAIYGLKMRVKGVAQ